MRNPEYPERTIHTQSSVTSLDFAERHPTLLAVGMYDGTIAIYDTAREGEVSFQVQVSTCEVQMNQGLVSGQQKRGKTTFSLRKAKGGRDGERQAALK